MICVRGALGRGPSNPSSIAHGLKELRIDGDDDEEVEGLVFMRKKNGYKYLRRNPRDDDKLKGMALFPIESVILSVNAINNEEGHSYGNVKVWIFSKQKTYVHREIFLPTLPLCTEWLSGPLLEVGRIGNFLAFGSTGPSIHIWDLDDIDAVKPCVVLCGTDGHTDSVLGLAWNKHCGNILASASADKRVKFWDIVAGRCDNTLEHHSDKVQAVAWSPNSPHALLSGSVDRTVVLTDRRTPSRSVYQWSVTADVKSLAWDSSYDHGFVVGLENGSVTIFDIRAARSYFASELSSYFASKLRTSTFTIPAHDKAVTSVSYSPLSPGLIATGSADETVKLWDFTTQPQATLVASNNPEAGGVLSIAFLADNPFLLAIGGSSGELKVWDTFAIPSINQEYGISESKKARFLI